jgi:membrane protein
VNGRLRTPTFLARGATRARANLVGRLDPLRDMALLTSAASWQALRGFLSRDNLTYAASIAYYGLLSLFPVFLLVFAILGQITADVCDRDAVLSFLLRYFPAHFQFITSQLDDFRSRPLTFSTAGTTALLWGALGVFGALTTAVNYAWGVEKQPSFWKHKLVSFVMLLLAGGILVITLLLVSAAEVVRSTWLGDMLARSPYVWALRSLTVNHAATLLFILVVGLIYYFIPNAKVRFQDVWLGAIITGLLWEAALDAFTWYVRDMSRFTWINGSIATVVVFMLWVYIQAVILLYGVEFTAAYARLRRGRPEEAPAAATPRI